MNGVTCDRCGIAHWRGVKAVAVAVDRRVLISRELCPPCEDFVTGNLVAAFTFIDARRAPIPFAGVR